MASTRPVSLTVGPPSGLGNVPDLRSAQAAKDLMEENARRAFALKARSMRMVWPTVQVKWDGLVLAISGGVANG